MRFLVLGAAAGGGLPQWNCGCGNCNMARAPHSGLRPQTQSSLAVSIDGENWAILNASPDIRQQITDNRPLHPRALRDTPIRSLVVTNGDIDHIAGLLVLREKQAFELFLTTALSRIIDDNPVFRALDPDFVKRRTIALEQPFPVLPGLMATLFAVPGKVPLFMEPRSADNDALRLGDESDQTVGIEFSAGGIRAFYIPGCGAMPAALADRLQGADLVFFDGTLFADDEMIAMGAGSKTARRMGHMPIDGEGGSLEALGRLRIGRKVYVHINNTNPIWRDGAERDKVRSFGVEIGFDGMEVSLAARP